MKKLLTVVAVTRVLNYAAIGSVIGHESTHGFDDVGSQFDAVGSLVSWWSEQTRAEFTRRADCMRQQYSNYSLPGLQVLTNDSHVSTERIEAQRGAAISRRTRIPGRRFPERTNRTLTLCTCREATRKVEL